LLLRSFLPSFHSFPDLLSIHHLHVYLRVLGEHSVASLLLVPRLPAHPLSLPPIHLHTIRREREEDKGRPGSVRSGRRPRCREVECFRS